MVVRIPVSSYAVELEERRRWMEENKEKSWELEGAMKDKVP